MGFPQQSIFAFNANIDHVKFSDESALAAIDSQLPQLASQISDSFSWGVQKEITIDVKVCEWLLANIKFDSQIVGGQAGNAAQQASALGVQCFLHSNFANPSLAKLFSHKGKVFFAEESGFVPAASVSSTVKSAHHFVFENRENATRFIASYDPLPLHPEDNFCRHIDSKLAGISKAFVGGLHLVQRPDRMRKFLSEMKRWKEINPGLKIFLEMGQFQSQEVLDAARAEVLPFVDMVGLNDTELAQLGCELEELASEVQSLLFHSPGKQQVLPENKSSPAALEYARRCASFLAEKGAHATQQDLAGYESRSVEAPVRTIGLGDAFSCAYFMAAD
ncbi:MAG: ADP-dependent glucokinase/phosphofructokinase [Candidatus Anstonellaceae archaeon]